MQLAIWRILTTHITISALRLFAVTHHYYIGTENLKEARCIITVYSLNLP